MLQVHMHSIASISCVQFVTFPSYLLTLHMFSNSVKSFAKFFFPECFVYTQTNSNNYSAVILSW